MLELALRPVEVLSEATGGDMMPTALARTSLALRVPLRIPALVHGILDGLGARKQPRLCLQGFANLARHLFDLSLAQDDEGLSAVDHARPMHAVHELLALAISERGGLQLQQGLPALAC